MRKLLAVMFLLWASSAIAADNAVTLTTGTGVTMRTIDIGAGVQSSVVILGSSAGAAIYGTAGTANANVLTVQGIGTSGLVNVSTVGNVSSASADSGAPSKIGCKYSVAILTFTANNRTDCQSDGDGNLKVSLGIVPTTLTGWTSATALNTSQVVMVNHGAPAILIQLNQTSTITGGAVTIEGTYDGTFTDGAASAPIVVPVAQVINPNTFALLTNPYTLVATTNQAFLVLVQGYQSIRIRLTTAITGSATVTPFVTLLNYNPTIGALLNPLAAGTAVLGKVGVDQTTPGTTNGVSIVGINAATALAGNGVTGTGSQRVTIASDNTAFSVNATLSAETTKVIGTVRNVGNVGGVFDAVSGAAVPANLLYAGVNVGGNITPLVGDPCQTNARSYQPISQTTSTQLFAGTSAKKTYVCHVFVMANAAETVTLVSGTGTVCATSPHAMIGPGSVTALSAISANGGFSLGNGGYAIAASTTNADNVCLVQLGAVQLTGVISYVTQ